MRLLVVSAALCVTLPIASGCGLFEPRDPVKGGTISSCIQLTAADSAQATIQRSYGDPAGVTCYTGALDASFAFHPDPTDSIEDSQSNPAIYSNWNLSVESRVAINLSADAAFCEAVFDSEVAPRNISSDGKIQTRFYAYHLNFRSRADTTLAHYQGLTDITFQQGQGDALWRITTWVDKRDTSGNPTWGRLRRNYRTGF